MGRENCRIQDPELIVFTDFLFGGGICEGLEILSKSICGLRVILDCTFGLLDVSLERAFNLGLFWPTAFMLISGAVS